MTFYIEPAMTYTKIRNLLPILFLTVLLGLKPKEDSFSKLSNLMITNESNYTAVHPGTRHNIFLCTAKNWHINVSSPLLPPSNPQSSQHENIVLFKYKLHEKFLYSAEMVDITDK